MAVSGLEHAVRIWTVGAGGGWSRDGSPRCGSFKDMGTAAEAAEDLSAALLHVRRVATRTAAIPAVPAVAESEHSARLKHSDSCEPEYTSEASLAAPDTSLEAHQSSSVDWNAAKDASLRLLKWS